jgi:hypothetical protein
VPLPAAQPVTLKIPRDGVLVDYEPRPRPVERDPAFAR